MNLDERNQGNWKTYNVEILVKKVNKEEEKKFIIKWEEKLLLSAKK